MHSIVKDTINVFVHRFVFLAKYKCIYLMNCAYLIYYMHLFPMFLMRPHSLHRRDLNAYKLRNYFS